MRGVTRIHLVVLVFAKVDDQGGCRTKLVDDQGGCRTKIADDQGGCRTKLAFMNISMLKYTLEKSCFICQLGIKCSITLCYSKFIPFLKIQLKICLDFIFITV